jgi:hypothetical protein
MMIYDMHLMTGIGFCPGARKMWEHAVMPQTRQNLTSFRVGRGYKDALFQLNNSFDLLYAKRAFVHHYHRCGVELESYFSEAREDLAAQECSYRDFYVEDHWCCGEEEDDY